MRSMAMPPPRATQVSGILGHHHRQTGLRGNQPVEVAQQRTATGEHDPALGDIRREFRRRLLQRRLHRLHDGGQGILQRFENLVAVEREASRHALGQVAPAHVDLAHFAARKGAADLLLDLLGGGIADQRAVASAHVGDDGLVEAVAAEAHRIGVDHAVEGDDGDFRGAAADVHDHAAGGLLDLETGADRRGHGLLDQAHFPGAGAQRGFADRAALDLRGLAGHADQHPGLGRMKRVSCTLAMKCWSIFSVTWKSAMTPSLSGRIAVMLPGVRPSMRLASMPTASMVFWPLCMRIATTEGSSSTMPWPRT
jgi:hypothetical protein